MIDRKRAPRNRTITLDPKELQSLRKNLIKLESKIPVDSILNKTICQDLYEAVKYLPTQFVDLLFIDPPYNLDKHFNQKEFKKMNLNEYAKWVEGWLSTLIPLLKPQASIYICADWRSSSAIFDIGQKYFKIRNRITWEREKGRGALKNWKNCLEDIWFFTMSDDYIFNLDDIKVKRKVLAPYRHNDGNPKDWEKSNNGNYRITHPSNLWTDLTVPFWSMPENTDHPTQKPEKLLAKIILASSLPNDIVFDPFLGSGTTSVVAKKLKRKYVGIEIDELFSCLAEKRLEIANIDTTIQGYEDGVFWERNTLNEQQKNNKSISRDSDKYKEVSLFNIDEY